MNTFAAAAAIAGLVALPSFAAARPITAGVGLGRLEAKADANNGSGTVDTKNVFARLGLTPRIAAQLELQRLDSADGSTQMKSGTLLVEVELASGGRLMPMMFGGLGIDKISSPSYGFEASGSHKEGGFALEYRADGGFVIGADLRLGGISIDPQYMLQNVAYTTSPQSSEYRSARLYAAIRL